MSTEVFFAGMYALDGMAMPVSQNLYSGRDVTKSYPQDQEKKFSEVIVALREETCEHGALCLFKEEACGLYPACASEKQSA